MSWVWQLTEREKKNEVFTLNNMVLFPFTEMGKIVEKTGLWRNEKFHLNLAKFEIRRSVKQLRE